MNQDVNWFGGRCPDDRGDHYGRRPPSRQNRRDQQQHPQLPKHRPSYREYQGRPQEREYNQGGKLQKRDVQHPNVWAGGMSHIQRSQPDQQLEVALAGAHPQIRHLDHYKHRGDPEPDNFRDLRSRSLSRNCPGTEQDDPRDPRSRSLPRYAPSGYGPVMYPMIPYVGYVPYGQVVSGYSLPTYGYSGSTSTGYGPMPYRQDQPMQNEVIVTKQSRIVEELIMINSDDEEPGQPQPTPPMQRLSAAPLKQPPPMPPRQGRPIPMQPPPTQTIKPSSNQPIQTSPTQPMKLPATQLMQPPPMQLLQPPPIQLLQPPPIQPMQPPPASPIEPPLPTDQYQQHPCVQYLQPNYGVMVPPEQKGIMYPYPPPPVNWIPSATYYRYDPYRTPAPQKLSTRKIMYNVKVDDLLSHSKSILDDSKFLASIQGTTPKQKQPHISNVCLHDQTPRTLFENVDGQIPSTSNGFFQDSPSKWMYWDHEWSVCGRKPMCNCPKCPLPQISFKPFSEQVPPLQADLTEADDADEKNFDRTLSAEASFLEVVRRLRILFIRIVCPTRNIDNFISDIEAITKLMTTHMYRANDPPSSSKYPEEGGSMHVMFYIFKLIQQIAFILPHMGMENHSKVLDFYAAIRKLFLALLTFANHLMVNETNRKANFNSKVLAALILFPIIKCFHFRFDMMVHLLYDAPVDFRAKEQKGDEWPDGNEDKDPPPSLMAMFWRHIFTYMFEENYELDQPYDEMLVLRLYVLMQKWLNYDGDHSVTCEYFKKFQKRFGTVRTLGRRFKSIGEILANRNARRRRGIAWGGDTPAMVRDYHRIRRNEVKKFGYFNRPTRCGEQMISNQDKPESERITRTISPEPQGSTAEYYSELTSYVESPKQRRLRKGKFISGKPHLCKGKMLPNPPVTDSMIEGQSADAEFLFTQPQLRGLSEHDPSASSLSVYFPSITHSFSSSQLDCDSSTSPQSISGVYSEEESSAEDEIDDMFPQTAEAFIEFICLEILIPVRDPQEDAKANAKKMDVPIAERIPRPPSVIIEAIPYQQIEPFVFPIEPMEIPVRGRQAPQFESDRVAFIEAIEPMEASSVAVLTPNETEIKETQPIETGETFSRPMAATIPFEGVRPVEAIQPILEIVKMPVGSVGEMAPTGSTSISTKPGEAESVELAESRSAGSVLLEEARTRSPEDAMLVDAAHPHSPADLISRRPCSSTWAQQCHKLDHQRTRCIPLDSETRQTHSPEEGMSFEAAQTPLTANQMLSRLERSYSSVSAESKITRASEDGITNKRASPTEGRVLTESKQIPAPEERLLDQTIQPLNRSDSMLKAVTPLSEPRVSNEVNCTLEDRILVRSERTRIPENTLSNKPTPLSDGPRSLRASIGHLPYPLASDMTRRQSVERTSAESSGSCPVQLETSQKNELYQVTLMKDSSSESEKKTTDSASNASDESNEALQSPTMESEEMTTRGEIIIDEIRLLLKIVFDQSRLHELSLEERASLFLLQIEVDRGHCMLAAAAGQPRSYRTRDSLENSTEICSPIDLTRQSDARGRNTQLHLDEIITHLRSLNGRISLLVPSGKPIEISKRVKSSSVDMAQVLAEVREFLDKISESGVLAKLRRFENIPPHLREMLPDRPLPRSPYEWRRRERTLHERRFSRPVRWYSRREISRRVARAIISKYSRMRIPPRSYFLDVDSSEVAELTGSEEQLQNRPIPCASTRILDRSERSLLEVFCKLKKELQLTRGSSFMHKKSESGEHKELKVGRISLMEERMEIGTTSSEGTIAFNEIEQTDGGKSISDSLIGSVGSNEGRRMSEATEPQASYNIKKMHASRFLVDEMISSSDDALRKDSPRASSYQSIQAVEETGKSVETAVSTSDSSRDPLSRMQELLARGMHNNRSKDLNRFKSRFTDEQLEQDVAVSNSDSSKESSYTFQKMSLSRPAETSRGQEQDLTMFSSSKSHLAQRRAASGPAGTQRSPSPLDQDLALSSTSNFPKTYLDISSRPPKLWDTSEATQQPLNMTEGEGDLASEERSSVAYKNEMFESAGSGKPSSTALKMKKARKKKTPSQSKLIISTESSSTSDVPAENCPVKRGRGMPRKESESSDVVSTTKYSIRDDFKPLTKFVEIGSNNSGRKSRSEEVACEEQSPVEDFIAAEAGSVSSSQVNQGKGLIVSLPRKDLIIPGISQPPQKVRLMQRRESDSEIKNILEQGSILLHKDSNDESVHCAEREPQTSEEFLPDKKVLTERNLRFRGTLNAKEISTEPFLNDGRVNSEVSHSINPLPYETLDRKEVQRYFSKCKQFIKNSSCDFDSTSFTTSASPIVTSSISSMSSEKISCASSCEPRLSGSSEYSKLYQHSCERKNVAVQQDGTTRGKQKEPISCQDFYNNFGRQMSVDIIEEQDQGQNGPGFIKSTSPPETENSIIVQCRFMHFIKQEPPEEVEEVDSENVLLTPQWSLEQQSCVSAVSYKLQAMSLCASKSCNSQKLKAEKVAALVNFNAAKVVPEIIVAARRPSPEAPPSVLRLSGPQNIRQAPAKKTYPVTFCEQKMDEIYAREFGKCSGESPKREDFPDQSAYARPRTSALGTESAYVIAKNSGPFQDPRNVWDASRCGTINVKSDAQLQHSTNLATVLKRPKSDNNNEVSNGQFEGFKQLEPASRNSNLGKLVIKLKRNDIPESLIRDHQEEMQRQRDLHSFKLKRWKREQEMAAAHERTIARAREMEAKERQLNQKTGSICCIFNSRTEGFHKPSNAPRKVRLEGETDDQIQRNHRGKEKFSQKRRLDYHHSEVRLKRPRRTSKEESELLMPISSISSKSNMLPFDDDRDIFSESRRQRGGSKSMEFLGVAKRREKSVLNL